MGEAWAMLWALEGMTLIVAPFHGQHQLPLLSQECTEAAAGQALGAWG